MYNYFRGIVTWIDENYIVLEVNNIGYEIYVETPSMYTENKEILIYIHHHKTEKEDVLYGFNTFLEKDLFNKFLKIKGYGTKTVFNLFKKKGCLNILEMNEEELLSLPKINTSNIKNIRKGWSNDHPFIF